MPKSTWQKLLYDVGGLIEKRSLWAAPLVVAFVSFVAAVGIAINWLMSNPPDGLRQSWAGEISAVLIASAIGLGSLWWWSGSEKGTDGDDA